MRAQILLNIIQTAALLGRDKADVSRAANAGAYGEPVIVGKRKFYRLPLIERAAGKQFTTPEVNAALRARGWLGPPNRQVVATLLARLIAGQNHFSPV